ncbi:sulfatase-like hydrolase/transferase, partial [Planctomycetota bacterium]
MKDHPNIILIMTDTQGVNAVGCYGRPELKTPCLDGMAEDGIRFDRAYTCQPVCGPARAALFTGNWPHTNGVLANNIPLGGNIRTVGERLTDNGYHSAYIGKWHVDGTDYFGNGKCPPGWDPEYWYDGRNYLEELTDEERLRWRKELHTAEGVHKYNMTADFTWAHRIGNRAVDFLEKFSADDAPFFLVVSYDEPHGPFTCPPPYCDMFADFEYEVGPAAHDSLEDKPAHQRDWAQPLPADQDTIKNPMYFGCNSFVDDEIGRVLNAAEKHAPEALVIYTSDHGTPLKAHGLGSKGPAMYDDTTRVPFIVKWQGRAPAG